MYFLCVLLNDTEWPIQCERTCQTVGDRDRSIIGIGVGWLVFLKKLVLVSVCYSNAKIDIRIGIFLFKDFGPPLPEKCAKLKYVRNSNICKIQMYS